MKNYFTALILFLSANSAFSQQAQDYFPSQLGFKWNYKVTPLDSLNNDISGLAYRRTDSSAFIADYEGREAYHILSKTATDELINLLPYTDTNYINLSGTDGYEYFNLGALKAILNGLDSAGIGLDSSLLNIFNSFRGWRSVYRFAQNVNQQYQVFSFDTTVTIDSLTIPLRFETRGRRLTDENLETEIGPFLCKKFVVSDILSYLIIFPPLPPIPVAIATVIDTVWIAPENWIVKSFIPSTEIDLTFFGLGSYIIPGLKTEIIDEVTSVEQEPIELPLVLDLEQNYPNPFNPSTTINFSLNGNGFITLKVYDILGNEIAVLINNFLSPGYYKINFDGNNFAGGVYFYNIIVYSNSGLNYSETKQMVLIK